uniref:Reverse transcriptase domain-containing protein n=1 Tax=Tanacetum cinerariifolium TaxID=118510 RepID=A0A699GSI9_TANCI|nr:reverse transcriptase domain-containing protein [Tanacetum cinerariifolium]
MIKEHDKQAKMKATPRKLAYADSDKEAPVGQTRSTIKSQKTPSKNKEPTRLTRLRRLEDQRKTKEKARRERSKPRRKRSGHQETSSDSEYEKGSDDAFEDLNSPYKRPKPTPFSQRITNFKYHKRAKLPRNIRVYEGNKDPKDHLGIFSTAAEQKEWPMPIWCKMFRQTLGGVARNWFNGLDPKSVDSFEELSQNFLDEFLQQKRYAKNTTEIHGIKRRPNEGLQAFMDRFKYESSHIKGIPPVLRISAFMYGHEMVRPSQRDKGYVRPAWTGGPERARNRGGLRETQRNMRVYTHYPRKYTFTPLTKTLKEILAMESRPQHQRLLSVKEANRGSRSLGKIGSSSEGHPPKQLAKWEPRKERREVQHHNRNDQNKKPQSKREGTQIPISYMSRPLQGMKDTEIRTYDTSYIQRKEVKGSMMRKFFGEGEQVGKMPNANKEETLNLTKKLHTKSTPTPRAWRLYLCKEAIEEGLGIVIIQVIPKEKMYLYAIWLKFKASNYAMDCEALLVGLAAFANQGIKDFYVFNDSLTLVAQVEGNHTPATKYKRRSVKRIVNYKARIPQLGSIGRYQNKTIGDKQLREKESNKQCTRNKTKLQPRS